MIKFYVFLVLVQVVIAQYESHNVTIEYSASTDELLISCYVKRDTYFSLGWGTRMDDGGGILFTGDHEFGNSSAFYMRGHGTPVLNPAVRWEDVNPPVWDG